MAPHPLLVEACGLYYLVCRRGEAQGRKARAVRSWLAAVLPTDADGRLAGSSG